MSTAIFPRYKITGLGPRVVEVVLGPVSTPEVEEELIDVLTRMEGAGTKLMIDISQWVSVNVSGVRTIAAVVTKANQLQTKVEIVGPKYRLDELSRALKDRGAPDVSKRVGRAENEWGKVGTLVGYLKKWEGEYGIVCLWREDNPDSSLMLPFEADELRAMGITFLRQPVEYLLLKSGLDLKATLRPMLGPDDMEKVRPPRLDATLA